ncbi:MAG: hypothetical protein HRT88_13240, partial [Lentisphaeraceae bacterium]|nr:hypothetical protein [Lentisphaeraceae bacterium]
MENIYSDSWHQVADLLVSLHHDTKISKQLFRGQKWYILQDSFNNRFFRVTPEAYRFLMKLDGQKPLGEIWHGALLENPGETRNQDEVVGLLSHLHSSNLLYFRSKANSRDIHERVLSQKNKQLKSKLSSFLFIRIPLWNPDSFLKKNKALIDVVFSKFVFVLWLVLAIFSVKAVVENVDKLKVQTQGVLAPSNLIYLYLCLVVLKLLHELGHGMMTRRFGGSVSNMGVMLLILTPIPYVDASSSWAFQSKFQRIMVGSAGMLVELFVAFIATIIWANTGEGLVHSLSFNVMLIGSISSLIFNCNPLLKFDSYYMLSDALEIPNMQERSRAQWYYWAEALFFRIHNPIANPAESKSESFYLALYGFLSIFYRLLVSLSIVLFIADKWFLLGTVIAVISFYSLILKPLYTYINYLLKEPRLQLKRQLAITYSVCLLFALITSIGFVPFYHSIRAYGVVRSSGQSVIYCPLEAKLIEVYVENGDAVKKGDPIALFANPDLVLQIEKLNSELDEIEMLMRQALKKNVGNLKPLRKKEQSMQKRLQKLKTKQSNLLMVSELTGVFVSHDLAVQQNVWFKEGQELGLVVNTQKYEFIAVVAQDEAYELFRLEKPKAEVRLYGSSSTLIETSN